MMKNHSQSARGQSAKIYQFPVGGRRALATHRENADAAERMDQRVSDAVSGCWYHEDAIRQAMLPTKS